MSHTGAKGKGAGEGMVARVMRAGPSRIRGLVTVSGQAWIVGGEGLSAESRESATLRAYVGCRAFTTSCPPDTPPTAEEY